MFFVLRYSKIKGGEAVKKFLSIFICITIIAGVAFGVSSVSFASQTEDILPTRLGDTDTFYSFDAGTKTLTISGEGNTPDFTNGGASPQPWYSWRNDGSIDKVVVENGVASIGKYMFYFVSASEFELPDTLKSLGAYSFSSVNSFDEMRIPNGVETISNYAFKFCSKLKKITVPKSVKTIGIGAFQDCSALENVEFADWNMNVSIGNLTFYKCRSLLEISLPKRAKLGKFAYGYSNSSSGITYENALMRVYRDSPAYDYALANFIDYEIITSAVINQGDRIDGAYFSDNVNDSFEFIFTPEKSGFYNFCSSGNVDLNCTVFDEYGEMIAQSEDVSSKDLNFFVSCEMNANHTYRLSVSSLYSTGNYTVTLLPRDVASVDFDGDISVSAPAENADKGYIFDVLPLINGRKLSVEYTNGFVDVIDLKPGSYNGTEIVYSDNQSDISWLCGENSYYISVGDFTDANTVTVTHTYTEEVIPPTTYEGGYTLYTCTFCGAEYKSDFTAKTGFDISGRVVLLENPNGGHPNDYPAANAKIYCNNRLIGESDENGYFSVTVENTARSIEISHFSAENRAVEISGSTNVGNVAAAGFDFNKDFYVNAVDYAIFRRTYLTQDNKNAYDIRLDYNRDGTVDDGDWESAKAFFLCGRLDEKIYISE